jgi:hypothetical protein
MSRRDLRPQHRNSLSLTAKDAAFSLIERTLEPVSVNGKKGATGRQRTWRPVAKVRFRGRGEPDAHLYYLSKEKLLSELCHVQTNLALMRLDDAPSGILHVSRRKDR